MTALPLRSRHAWRGAPAPGARRGFTLIELMVALTGGLVFSVFVFMLARDSSRFYQRESRVADATFGAIAGFQRLRTDIARAGYLSLPNLQRDVSFCGNPIGAGYGAVPGLASLASLRIQVGGSPANVVSTNSGLTPDALFLMGSYASPDQFPIRSVAPRPGGGYDVMLQLTSPAMRRLLARDITLASVFMPGRALRIVDQAGGQQFGIIAGPAATETNPVVVLSAQPGLQFKQGNNGCGLRGTESGSLVNVVQLIRYDLRSLESESQYTPIYSSDDTAPRTELVRTEMDFVNPAVALSGTNPELVAEFAVDFKLGLIGVTNPTTNTTEEIPAANIPVFAGDTRDAGTTSGPGLIRAVRARLSVRTRAADRDAVDLGPTAGVAPGLYRVDVRGAGESTPQFARVRTLQADIALRNQLR